MFEIQNGLSYVFLLVLIIHSCCVYFRIRSSGKGESKAYTLDDVEIIIPARNEERNLKILLPQLNFIYPDVKVTVVNDGSTDGTGLVPALYGFSCIQGSPLPPGWTGKNWACMQGAQRSKQKVLLFLDADVKLLKGSLEKALKALGPESPLVSAIPIHDQSQWYTKFFFGFWVYVFLGSEFFGKRFCIGQFMMMESRWYFDIGGHEKVKGTMAEDLSFVNLVISQKKTYTLLEPGIFEVNMYPDGIDTFMKGWKRLFQSAQSRLSFLVFGVTIAYLAGFVNSIVDLFAGHYLLFAAYTLVHGAQMRFLKLKGFNLVFLPLSLMFFALLNLWAIVYRVFFKNQMVWKGRTFQEKF